MKPLTKDHQALDAIQSSIDQKQQEAKAMQSFAKAQKRHTYAGYVPFAMFLPRCKLARLEVVLRKRVGNANWNVISLILFMYLIFFGLLLLAVALIFTAFKSQSL